MSARPAESAPEKREAARLVSRVFQASMGGDWEAALRLSHPRYREVRWWTWREDGRALGALVCAPLRWDKRLWEAPRPGYALGSVAVLSEHRGRDIGRRLVAAVMEERQAAGAGRGLLFAAIAPRVYAPLGFRTHKAVTVTAGLPALRERESRPSVLTPVDPFAEAEALAQIWRRAHRGASATYVHRDPAQLRATLSWSREDVFFRLSGGSSGFLRLRDQPESDALEVIESVLETDQASLAEAIPSAYSAIASLGLSLGRTRLEGWWPSSWPAPATVLGSAATARPRHYPPMTHGLDLDAPLALWSSDEI